MESAIEQFMSPYGPAAEWWPGHAASDDSVHSACAGSLKRNLNHMIYIVPEGKLEVLCTPQELLFEIGRMSVLLMILGREYLIKWPENPYKCKDPFNNQRIFAPTIAPRELAAIAASQNSVFLIGAALIAGDSALPAINLTTTVGVPGRVLGKLARMLTSDIRGGTVLVMLGAFNDLRNRVAKLSKKLLASGIEIDTIPALSLVDRMLTSPYVHMFSVPSPGTLHTSPLFAAIH